MNCMCEEDFYIPDDEPIEWRCGGCDAYWFEEPFYEFCPFCGQDAIVPIYEEEGGYYPDVL